MDTNPFAVNPNAQQQTPAYLQPQQTGAGTAGAMGNVANMVKAMLDGNNKFQQKSSLNATSPNPMTTTGGPSVGAPMNLGPPSPGPSMGAPSPNTNPASMPGASAGPMGPMSPVGPMPNTGDIFNTGAQPMPGIDPVTQALFSPIPGGNGGQQF